MQDNYVYLGYYNMLVFIDIFEKIREYNPTYRNFWVEDFERYFEDRTNEIKKSYLSLFVALVPNFPLYSIPFNKFKYLTELTTIDVYDRETVMEIRQRIKKNN